MATARKVMPIKSVTSWSFSRYTDYARCPGAFKLKHIDRLKEPGNTAMERGTAIHTLAEKYVRGELKKLPVELRMFEDEFSKLRRLYKAKKFPMVVEDDWAFTRKWTETEWNNWADCWVRIKLDLAYYVDGLNMKVVDYKTGKMNDYRSAEYMEQLELYALAALLMSSIEDVTVWPEIMYLDHGAKYTGGGAEPVRYTRADIPRLTKLWEKRVAPMFNDTRYAFTPNSGCKWCYFGQSGKVTKNGPGLCKY